MQLIDPPIWVSMDVHLPDSIDVGGKMHNHRWSIIHAALSCAALLAIAAPAIARDSLSLPPLSQQCGISPATAADATAKPYLDALVAVGGTHATWGDAICTEAHAPKADNGLDRLQAVLGAHLLRQLSTRDALTSMQSKQIGQAVDCGRRCPHSRDRMLELVYVNLRNHAALADMSIDGLAYQLKDTAPAVAKLLDSFSSRWGP